MSTVPEVKNTLLVVDDMVINRLLIRNIFENDYTVIEADNGQDALALIDELGDTLAVVLLDLVMPIMNGFEVLEQMRKSGRMETVPVIVITSENDDEQNLKIYELGISDLIHKPFNAELVYRRVNNVATLYAHQHILHQQLQEQKLLLEEQQARLQLSNQLVIDALSTAVEFRSFESTEHIVRIRELTNKFLFGIQDEYSLTDEQIQKIANASAVHDIGKIMVPDQILLKPGRLTSEEFEVIKTHPQKGADLLLQLTHLKVAMDDEFFGYCYDICLYHHEKWDGKGYPVGLVGEQIPIWAQATALADIYDALTAKRVYKPPYTPEVTVQMILDGQCGQINPKLLNVMVELFEKGQLA